MTFQTFTEAVPKTTSANQPMFSILQYLGTYGRGPKDAGTAFPMAPKVVKGQQRNQTVLLINKDQWDYAHPVTCSAAKNLNLIPKWH